MAPRRKLLDKVCPICHETFRPKTATSKYCNMQCAGIGNRRAVDIEKVCGYEPCSKSFTVREKFRNRIFCSRGCSSSYRNVSRTFPRNPCKNCGELVKEAAHTYCNGACHKEYLYNTYIAKWLSGEESGNSDFGMSKTVWRWVREKEGLKCWDCGWDTPHPVSGEPPVQVDHIDGDARNNRPENLRLLCPNCHSLTETWGNRGGRTSSRTYRYDKSQK